MKHTLKGLKKFMAYAKTVAQWNALREVAKKSYPQELINQLDASGHIIDVLNK